MAKKNGEVELVSESNILEEIKRKAAGFLEDAKAVVKIKTDAERRLVAALLVTNKDLQKQIHDELDPIVEQAHKTWQMNLALRKRHLDPLVEEEGRCKTMQRTDFQEQQAAAEEKRRKLQAEADAKAEAERKKEVAALKKSGQKEEAKALAAAPVAAAPVVVENKAQAAAEAAGLTYRFQKHMEVRDELIIDRQYLQPNLSAIQAAGAAYWETIKPSDPKDTAQVSAAMAKFEAWAGVAGVHFWVTKEASDTGRRR